MKNDHLKRIVDAVQDWLRPDSFSLKEAIDRTVIEGFFSFQDVKHQIMALKKTLTGEALANWAEDNRLKPGALNNRKVLCLHAGNLPIVGIQDLLASALTGVRYHGKISRNDPYLLPTFLEKLKSYKVLGDTAWSTDINDLEGCRADKILFSGSSRSVGKVKDSIKNLQLADRDARYLIRTAHYSIAFINSTDPATMQDLTEAVFRYGGQGCRSVAVVIAPFSLDSSICHFTDYIESFWLKNPQHRKPPSSLFHRYAYNRAVGHTQSWLDDFLIEQTEMTPEQEFVLHWIVGDKEKVPGFISLYGSGLQSVYVTHRNLHIPGLHKPLEILSGAQAPPVNWKPDGVDVIQWLMA